MAYYIERGGKQWGPYTLDDLRRMLAAGQVVTGDMVTQPGAPSPVPLYQVVESPVAPPPPPPLLGVPAFGQPALRPPAFGQPEPPPAGSTGPAPPDLHWLLLMIIGYFCGLLPLVWLFVQANFVRRLRPASDSRLYFVLYLVATMAAVGLLFLPMFLPAAAFPEGESPPAILVIAFLALIVASLVLFEIGCFRMKGALEDYYNSEVPIGLRLSGPMVFIFNVIYFQYYLGHIARWRTTGIPI